MAFDLGEMMEQIKSSMSGGGSGGSGGGANGKRVYDAAIVGYGPAGGVMVSVNAGAVRLVVGSVPGEENKVGRGACGTSGLVVRCEGRLEPIVLCFMRTHVGHIFYVPREGS